VKLLKNSLIENATEMRHVFTDLIGKSVSIHTAGPMILAGILKDYNDYIIQLHHPEHGHDTYIPFGSILAITDETKV